MAFSPGELTILRNSYRLPLSHTVCCILRESKLRLKARLDFSDIPAVV